MKTRSLLPPTVLDDQSVASVDRILSRSFWSDPPTGDAVVVPLEPRPERARREPAAAGER